MIKKILIIFLILFPFNAIALIEVDITRGNLNPLPIAVSPLSIDENSRLSFKKIIKKENIGTTIGNGIVITNVQNHLILKPSCIVTILSKGLDFDALDNDIVDLIVLLILPEVSKPENLQILAQVSRLLRKSEITDKLRGCHSKESAYAIISQHLKNKAA